MPRRHHDPAGLSNPPVLVTDPVREAELVARCFRRFEYAIRSYRNEKLHPLGTIEFNKSLARLKRSVSRPRDPAIPETRLSPWLEYAISTGARELAGLSPDDPILPEHNSFIQRSARALAKRTKPIRGRPRDAALHRLVQALMAIYQEATGKPVFAKRDKNSVYEPQLTGAFGEIIRRIVRGLEPDVTETQLVNIIRNSRRKFAGKPMRFFDFCPGYGAVTGATGKPVLRPPYTMASVEIIAPIYCP